MKSYKDLDVYNLGLELFYKCHSYSLQLPKHEMYELGSQLRRSSDSVPTNIVEGYGRKRYKADFIKFLTYSYASCLETYFISKKLLFCIQILLKTNKILLISINMLKKTGKHKF